MYEDCLKVLLIDYLLDVMPSDSLITCEMPFSDSKRRADVVCISDQTHAYEIKGEKDNLDSLIGQLKDYKSCFTSTSIVITEKHLIKAKRIVPKEFGIMLVLDKKIIPLRKASNIKRLDKLGLASFLDIKSLISLLKNNNIYPIKKHFINSYYLKIHACKKLSTNTIYEEVILFFRKKYLPRYKLFLKERGDVTHVEDLIYLTSLPDELI